MTHLRQRGLPRLWVVTDCYPRPGALAACAFAHRQMTGVRRAGYDVRVLVPNGWFPPLIGPVARAWREARARHIPGGWTLDGISVTDLPHQNRVPSRLSRPVSTVERVALALEERLISEGVEPDRDIVMVQFALPWGPAVRLACARLGLPYVVQLRGDDVWVWPHRSAAVRRGFTEAVGDAALVLAVSQALLDAAATLCEGTLPPTAVVPNGIDLARFRPPHDDAERGRIRTARSIGVDRLVLLSVGDALVRKGWLDLLDALGRLEGRFPELLLVAVHSTRFKEVDIEAEAARRAPKVEVRIFRNAAPDLTADLFRAADAFALASHWEGMANALLEALASGLPVVTTAVSGHPEAVTDGREGWLVPARAPDRLANALSAVLASAPDRERMGRAARERAEAIGDSDGAGQRIARLLDRLRERPHDADALGAALSTRSPYAPLVET